MIRVISELVEYRELIWRLAWKNIVSRYKQAYLGIAWAVFKPLMLMLVFTLVRSFVGIDSGDIPYPILTFAALLPWTFFQEATSDGVNSIVANSNLIRKIYFPREIFPVTAVITKLVELSINFAILAGLMLYFQMSPTLYILWVPVIIIYTIMVSLTLSLVGSAMNVYYRDVATALPLLIMTLMYASPVIYPLSLVKETLLVQQAAGEWSNTLFTVYTFNPLVGIIDAFQRVVLQGLPPDFSILWPGIILTVILLPISHLLFKRAENYFADII